MFSIENSEVTKRIRDAYLDDVLTYGCVLSRDERTAIGDGLWQDAAEEAELALRYPAGLSEADRYACDDGVEEMPETVLDLERTWLEFDIAIEALRSEAQGRK